jgi:hypothetical protein
MRKQKYTQPMTVYVTTETYQHIKHITDRDELSFGEWIRRAINEALKNKQSKSYDLTKEFLEGENNNEY